MDFIKQSSNASPVHPPRPTHQTSHLSPPATSFKVPISPNSTPPTNKEIVTSLLSTLFTSSKSLPSLRLQLFTQVPQIHTQNLTTHLAKHLLDRLIYALNSGKFLGSAIKEALHIASSVAEAFVKEHPVLVAVTATLIAIGILVLVMPWAVEALGFGALGPVEDSFAALWQATFPDVTAGSWFAFFQRSGMIWGKTAVVMEKM